MEIVDVNYDYAYHPEGDYNYADIYGKLTLTLRVKGISVLWAEFSEYGYPNVESAPLRKFWMQGVNEQDEFVEVRYPIIGWGSWVRCGYLSNQTNERIYTPYVWSSDYIDQETWDLYFAGVGGITADRDVDTIGVSLMGKILTVTGLMSDSGRIEIYSLDGSSVFSSVITATNGTMETSLDYLSSGIYIIRVQDGVNALTTKIVLR